MEINNIITSTEAVKSFSDIMNKVYYQHQSFDIKKGEIVVARIIPCDQASKLSVKDLNEFFANILKLEKTDPDDFIKNMKDLRKNSKK